MRMSVYFTSMSSGTYRADRQALRELAHEVTRRELEIAGENRYPGQGNGELGGLVRRARSIGLAVTDIAARTGLTRPTIYDLVGGTRAQSLDDYTLRIAVAVYLAAQGVTTPEELASGLGVETTAVLIRLRLLRDEEQASEGLVGSGVNARPVFLPDTKLEEFLQDRLLVIGDTRDSSYAFYLEVETHEADRIQRAAERLLGSEQQALIDSHVSSAMRLPELALSLNAADDRQAFLIAKGIWRDILKEARIKPRPPSIALALPPQRRARAQS
jgi:hypothetical protein